MGDQIRFESTRNKIKQSMQLYSEVFFIATFIRLRVYSMLFHKKFRKFLKKRCPHIFGKVSVQSYFAVLVSEKRVFTSETSKMSENGCFVVIRWKVGESFVDENDVLCLYISIEKYRFCSVCCTRF